MKKNGMALVVVLILGVIGIIIITLGLSVSTIITQSNLQFSEGERAQNVAESGVENALLRVLRDPNYEGEVLTIDGETATIVVSGSNPRIITVTGSVGRAERTIQVQTTDIDGITTLTSWTEL
jgi:hypothetical protein